MKPRFFYGKQSGRIKRLAKNMMRDAVRLHDGIKIKPPV
jgi:hypothetical protein